MNEVSATVSTEGCLPRANWRDYLELTKPRVVALMLLTAYVGMQLASPTWVPLSLVVPTLLGIAFSAGAAAAINHYVDRSIDAKMTRTQARPIVVGKIKPLQALMFATVLTVASMILLLYWVNTLTAALTFTTLVGYAYIYTRLLKRLTSQNIVIGGLAGATPPLLGWVAVANQIDPLPLLMILIIFTWTPPHFWSLAIHRHKEYARSGLPMLPVTHGIPFTQTCIVLYTILLTVITMMPYFTHLLGGFYAVGAALLNICFIALAVQFKWFNRPLQGIRLFHYSNIYLLLLFAFMLGDHVS